MKMLLAATLTLLAAAPAQSAETECPAHLDHEVRKLRSTQTLNLCESFAGQPILIVNTASHCGFTPQFKSLEALHQRYKHQGFAVVGVPSNDFRQAAADEGSAAKVCFVNYGVTFTMLSPQKVRGPDSHPMFQALSERAGAPRWNFTKYLVDRDGHVIERFDSTVDPMSTRMRDAVESLL